MPPATEDLAEALRLVERLIVAAEAGDLDATSMETVALAACAELLRSILNAVR